MKQFYVTVKSISYYTCLVEAESRNDAVDGFDWDGLDWTSPDHVANDIDNVEEIKSCLAHTS
jgi:hypothetical protein